MLAMLLALALQGTDDPIVADHAARLLRAAHPEQVDLVARTYGRRCLGAVASLELGGGRELLLVETGKIEADRGCERDPWRPGHEWRLELVQGTPERAKLVSAVEVGKDLGNGGVQARIEPLAKSPFLVEIEWGLNNESDGGCTSREVWRIRGTRLERLLSFSSCNSGSDPGGGISSSRLSAVPSDAKNVRIDAWREEDVWGEEEPGWSARTTGIYMVGEASILVPRALASPVASSTLPPSRAGDYRAERAVDGDPKTAWCEGAPGPGLGQSFTLSFEPPMAVTAVTILPGYGKSPAAFRANARPRRVRIEAKDGPSMEQELRDAFDSQRLELPASAPATSVKLTVLSVWPGERFEDRCIAELFAEGRI